MDFYFVLEATGSMGYDNTSLKHAYIPWQFHALNFVMIGWYRKSAILLAFFFYLSEYI